MSDDITITRDSDVVGDHFTNIVALCELDEAILSPRRPPRILENPVLSAIGILFETTEEHGMVDSAAAGAIIVDSS